MASSKSGAGEAAELRRARESQGPAGYAGACPPESPRSGATSASLLCPWTLAPARSSRGGRRFIAKVCLRRPQPSPWAAAGDGGAGAPRSRPGRAPRLLRCSPLRFPSVGRPELAAADCSRELAGLRELRGVRCAFALPRHTPPFSSPPLGRVKKTKTGLSSPVPPSAGARNGNPSSPGGAAAWTWRRDPVRERRSAQRLRSRPHRRPLQGVRGRARVRRRRPQPPATRKRPPPPATAGLPARRRPRLCAESASSPLGLREPSAAELPADCCSGRSAGDGGVSSGGRGCRKRSGAREHGPRWLAAAAAAAAPGPLRSAPTVSSSRRARGVAGGSHADCSLILLSFSQNVNVLLTHTVLGRRLA